MFIIANDGYVIDTQKLHASFEEATLFNGYARVGKYSYVAQESSRQSMFFIEDRYYLTEMTVDNKVTFAHKLCHEDAARWLLNNNHHHALPDNLKNIPASLL